MAGPIVRCLALHSVFNGTQMFRYGSAGYAPKGQASVYATHPLCFKSDADAEGPEEDWP